MAYGTLTWPGGDEGGDNPAWSRGDGSYILSNAPSFDPSRVFQDQQWQEMKKPNR